MAKSYDWVAERIRAIFPNRDISFKIKYEGDEMAEKILIPPDDSKLILESRESNKALAKKLNYSDWVIKTHRNENGYKYSINKPVQPKKKIVKNPEHNFLYGKSLC